MVASSADFTVPDTQIAFEPEWETVFLRQERPRLRGTVDAAMLVAHAAFGAVARSELRAEARLAPPTSPKVSVGDSTWTVTTVGAPATAMAGAPAATFTQAAQHAAATGGAVLVADLAETLAAP